MFARDEKWASQSILETRIFCSALNSDLHLSNGGVITVVHGMEYRCDYNDIALDNYDAVMLVENIEAFIQIHAFNFSWIEKMLVVYRGHDISARAAKHFLESVTLPVYGFFDPDPAGMGMLMDNPVMTHAVIPSISQLDPKHTLTERFLKQIVSRPNLKQQSDAFSGHIRDMVAHIADKGIAYSQESICARNMRLDLIRLK